MVYLNKNINTKLNSILAEESIINLFILNTFFNKSKIKEKEGK